VIVIAFFFIISTLAFNIFTGIAIDEIRSLIEYSNVQIMRDKITYIYEVKVLKHDKITPRLFELLSCVFWVEDFVSSVKEVCLKKICEVEGEVDAASGEKGWQETYEEDRYLESFETLEDRAKKIENKIDKLLSVKGERKGKEETPVLPLYNETSLGDGGFKDLFKMVKKMSEKQESIDQQMKLQKETIDQQMKLQKESTDQIKESIDEQNIGINELAKQIAKIKKRLKAAKGNKSSEDHT